MEPDKIIKILCIGNNKLQNKIKLFEQNNFKYVIELLSNEKNTIKHRLQHNSYDILIIDYNFLRSDISILDIFSFNKMAFAMSRPSIILCNNIFQKLYLKCLLFHTSLLLKFQSAKSFIHILSNKQLKNNLYIINNSLVYHQYISKISNEIYTVFINE